MDEDMPKIKQESDSPPDTETGSHFTETLPQVFVTDGLVKASQIKFDTSIKQEPDGGEIENIPFQSTTTKENKLDFSTNGIVPIVKIENSTDLPPNMDWQNYCDENSLANHDDSISNDSRCDNMSYDTLGIDTGQGTHFLLDKPTKRKRVEYSRKCFNCNYVADSPKEINLHFRTVHFKDGYFLCQHCEYRSRIRPDLTRHYQRMHDSSDNYFECKECDYKSKHHSDLLRHMKTNHDPMAQVYACRFCTYTSKAKGNLLNHIKGKHDDSIELFKCDICGYKSKLKSNLLRHLKYQHDNNIEMISCEHCDYKTKYKSDLAKHFAQYHDPSTEVYSCNFCEYSTKKKCHFTSHFKRKHDTSSDNLIFCKFCPYTAREQSVINKHVKNMHDENPVVYSCDRCPYETTNKYYFTKHNKDKHNIDKFTYSCILCSYTTEIEAQFNSHFRLNHKSEVEYKCQLCDFKTKYEPSFKKHLQLKHESVTGETLNSRDIMENIDYIIDVNSKIISCTKCKYRCVYKSQMRAHFKNIHNATEQFQCNLCDFKTKTKFCLVRHLSQKHDKNDKILKCELCSYETKVRYNMKHHFRKKHSANRKMYECKKCDFKSKYRIRLSYHYNSVHKYNVNNNAIKLESTHENNTADSEFKQETKDRLGEHNHDEIRPALENINFVKVEIKKEPE